MATNTITSPNMNLPVPITGVDSGPDYANNIGACFLTVDGHNHTAGSGVQISPAGLNINSDLTFQGNNATNLRTTRFTPQLSAIPNSGSDVGELYVVGNELYYNDVTGGHQIAITSNGSVTGASGTITGLPSGTAGAAYNSVSGTFVFTSASNTAANLDCESVLLRNSTASSKALTLNPPASMSANYSLTLPLAASSATSFLQIDTSGNITPSAAVSGGLTGSNMISSINLPGKAVQEDGNNIVVASTNATNSLAIIRGSCTSSATSGGGEGFTLSTSGLTTGQVEILFDNDFNDDPQVFLQVTGTSSAVYLVPSGASEGAVIINTYSGGSRTALVAFNFLIIGQRS